MMAMGLLFGIAGALMWMVGGSNGWAIDYYGSSGHSARLLIGLSVVTILVGSMMDFGSQGQEEGARTTAAPA